MSQSGRLENHILGGHLWHATCKQNQASNSEQFLPVNFSSLAEYQTTFSPLLIEEAIEGLRSGFLEAVDTKKHCQIQFERFQPSEQSGWYEASLKLFKNNESQNGNKKYSLKEGQIATIINVNPADSNVRKFVRTGEWQFSNHQHHKRSRDDSMKSNRQKRIENQPIYILSGVVKRSNDQSTAIISFKIGCNFHTRENPDFPCIQIIDIIQQHMQNVRSQQHSNSTYDQKQQQQHQYQWWIVPCGNFITQQRELDALSRLGNVPLSPYILNPKMLKSDISQLSNAWPVQASSPGFLNFLRSQYDIPQLEAIELCASHLAHPTKHGREKKNFPFVLIQGPPGTGKTHTVKGILNTWHAALFNQYYGALEDYMKEEAGKQRVQVERLQGAGGDDRDRDVVGDILGGMEDGIWGKHAENQNEALMKPRVLVCAPSNAATDELVERITKEGFMGMDGKKYFPNIARVGSEEAPLSSEAKRVWTEQRVQLLLNTPLQDIETQFRTLNGTVRDRYAQIQFAQRQLIHDDGERCDELLKQIIHERERVDANEMQLRRLRIVLDLHRPGNDNNAAIRRARDALESTYLEEAQIVFTTLSSTGRSAFHSSQLPTQRFETVLVDEACQAQEVSTIQPLIFGCKRCVLVGDPQQLPATVLSQRAKKAKLDRSLFERLMQGGCPVKLLQVQYRMHPEIRNFPSKYFYQNKLTDGEEIIRRAERKPAKFYHHSLLKPYILFDVDSGKERRTGSSGSLRNEQEAEMALALFWELRTYLIDLKTKGETVEKCEVGIITPYREQRACIQETFRRYAGPEVAREVKIETIDSFQGKQMDVVIFSCVRAGLNGGNQTNGAGNSSNCVGFLQDIRRMNVAITRAKQAMWILGNFSTLKLDENWRALVEDAQERQVVISNASARELFKNISIWENNFLKDESKNLKENDARKQSRNENSQQIQFDGQKRYRSESQDEKYNNNNNQRYVNNSSNIVKDKIIGKEQYEKTKHLQQQQRDKNRPREKQTEDINRRQGQHNDNNRNKQIQSYQNVRNGQSQFHHSSHHHNHKHQKFHRKGILKSGKKQQFQRSISWKDEQEQFQEDKKIDDNQQSQSHQVVNSENQAKRQKLEIIEISDQEQIIQQQDNTFQWRSKRDPRRNAIVNNSIGNQSCNVVSQQNNSQQQNQSTQNTITQQNDDHQNGNVLGNSKVPQNGANVGSLQDKLPIEIIDLSQDDNVKLDVDYQQNFQYQQQQDQYKRGGRDPRNKIQERLNQIQNQSLTVGSDGGRFEAMSIDDAWVTAFTKAP